MSADSPLHEFRVHRIAAPLRHSVTGAIIRDEDDQPIMTYASADRDAVNAMKLGMLYSLGTPLRSTDVADGSVLNASYAFASEPLPASEPGEESVADLRRRASAMLEATVQAVNTRPSYSRKRV